MAATIDGTSSASTLEELRAELIDHKVALVRRINMVVGAINRTIRAVEGDAKVREQADMELMTLHQATLARLDDDVMRVIGDLTYLEGRMRQAQKRGRDE